MTWFSHDDTLFNLDKFTQIVRGDENEILLTTLSHNMEWEDEEDKICVLKFKSKEDREIAFNKICKLLMGVRRWLSQ